MPVSYSIQKPSTRREWDRIRLSGTGRCFCPSGSLPTTFSLFCPLFSLYIHRETTRSFFIPLSSSLVLHASRLRRLFLSSSPSLSEQSTPSIYLNPFVWRCLCPSHPSVCLPVSLCRIEYYPLNFNPAGIERRTTIRS